MSLFPPQDYHTLRANMKSLRLMAGLSQDIVYYIARHSFGTLMLSSGIPIESIAKMMDHTNKQYAGLCTGYRPEDIWRHGPADEKKTEREYDPPNGNVRIMKCQPKPMFNGSGRHS